MQVIQVKLKDGEVVSIQADTVPEAIAAAKKIELKREAAKAQANAPTPYGRYAGLAGRAGLEGVIEGPLGLPALAADGAYNLGALGYNNIVAPLNDDKSRMPYGMPASNFMSRVSDGAADMVGLPEPKTSAENLMFQAGKGGISALTGAGVTGMAAKAVTGAPRLQVALRAQAAGKVTQASGGAGGGFAGEYASQRDLPAWAQLSAGMLGGLAGGAAPQAASLGRALASPYTSGGRDRTVGRLLRDNAANPDTAMDNLAQYRDILPGSEQTTGSASRDFGLLNLERGAERMPDFYKDFQTRRSEQNLKRNEALRGISITPEEEAAMRQARTNLADERFNAFFDAPEVRDVAVSAQPVWEHLTKLEGSRNGDVDSVKDTIAFTVDQLNRVSNESDFAVNAGRLYSIRRNLQAARDGMYRSERYQNVPNAKREINEIIAVIDDAIETGAPGFKSTMSELSGSAKDINAGVAGRTVYEKSQSKGVADVVTGEPQLVLSGLKRSLADPDLVKQLKPGQVSVAQMVLDDLELGMAGNLRPAGSDTFQNITIAQVLGAAIGRNGADSALGQQAGKVLKVLYGSSEQQTLERLREAMLDPKLASILMRKATKGNLDYASSMLNKTLQGGKAGLVAGQQAQAEPGNVERRKPLMVDVYAPAK